MKEMDNSLNGKRTILNSIIYYMGLRNFYEDWS